MNPSSPRSDSISQSKRPATEPRHHWPTHRPLSEEVLQSAEEAALDEAVVAPIKGGAYAGQPVAGQPVADVRGVAPTQASSAHDDAGELLNRAEAVVRRYVTDKPVKAALLAAGAGALLAYVLGRGLRQRGLRARLTRWL